MQILRVHINNLNSLRQQITIDFESPPLAHAGIFAITGPTGAGKTTILDAITLALYGQIARSGKDVKEVISYGATECHAEVEFAIKNEKYLASWRMHRARNKVDGNLVGPKRELAKWDAKAQVFTPLAEKIKEVDEAVEKITKLDYQRFSRSVLLSQGDFAAFLKSDERERSNLLERITGTRIYSEISIAAFDRFRLEQQKLNQLRERLEQLGLLSDETVEETEVEAQRQLANKLTKEADQHQATVQKLDRWQESRQRLLNLEEEIKKLEEEETNFLPSANRLKKSEALRPFHAEFEQIRLADLQHKELSRELLSLDTQLKEYNDNSSVIQSELTAAQLAFKTLKTQASEKEIIFRNVDRLDQRIATEQQDFQRLSKEKETLEQTYNEISKRLEVLRQNSKQNQEELTVLNSWLTDHQQFEQLTAQLPLIEEQREQLLDIFKLQTKLNTEKISLSGEQETKVQAQKELVAKEQELTKLLSLLQTSFNEALPDDFKLDQQVATQRLSNAIVGLQEKQQLVRQLKDLDEEYQRLLHEQQTYESRLEELIMAQQNNNKELLSVNDLRLSFGEELNYKKAIYQQQQLIANYEKDRQQLQPGVACPLCLSEEHPFHDHPVKPFVDRAKQEYEKAEAYDARLQAEERQLLQQETSLHQEIESLHGNDLKPVNGRLHTLREKLLHYEERIAVLLHAPDKDWVNGRGQILQKQLSELDKQLQLWRKAQLALDKLELQVKETTESLQDLERKSLSIKGEQQTIEAQLERVYKDEKEFELKFKLAKQKLDAIIQPMGYVFSLKNAKQTFLELRNIGDAYKDKRDKKQEKEQQATLMGSQLKSLVEQESNQSDLLKERNQKLAQHIDKQQKTIQERTALLGKQAVDAARSALQLKISEEESKAIKLQEDKTTLSDKLARVQQSHQDKLQEQQKRIVTIEQLNKRLLPALKKLGYESVDGARIDQLEAAEEKHLQERALQIKQSQAEAQRAFKEATQEELKFRPEDTTPASLTAIRNTWQAARSQHDEALLQLGQMEQRYKLQQARKKRHELLMEEINQQTQIFNRWAQLNEIIGQADGKKFRTYAQGLTLERLVALANQHLEKLNGRYFISKQTNSDLALEIIDTFQADNRRSMFTLSGGESFLISLALALGLSDLAGRHAQIQSLFIDEGFGTLDEHSLDLALDTLENLQSAGKTIGIISHVKALKERIGVQIQVHKKSNGFSYLSLV